MAVPDKNACAFYASDYHMEMIMLPYINENFKNKKNVYVFTQNNLEETIKHLVKNVNINKDIKEKVLNINWKNEDESKYKTLIEDKSESIIFVKGNENYIEKINKNLNQIKNYKNIEIIDCYSLEEVGIKTEEIRQNYKNVLMTNGKI
ncbi:MAG: hypothetical protein IJJ82_06975 [Clostridia bacterium]|nr:hypothetical protein [Clostridia bacterium]